MSREKINKNPKDILRDLIVKDTSGITLWSIALVLYRHRYELNLEIIQKFIYVINSHIDYWVKNKKLSPFLRKDLNDLISDDGEYERILVMYNKITLRTTIDFQNTYIFSQHYRNGDKIQIPSEIWDEYYMMLLSYNTTRQVDVIMDELFKKDNC